MLKFYLTLISVILISIMLSTNLTLATTTITTKAKNDFYKNLKCLECTGQSVFDSNSDFANNIKTLTEQMLANGQSLDDIKQYLINSYGEAIMMSPQDKTKHFILWLIPYLFTIAASLYVFYLAIDEDE